MYSQSLVDAIGHQSINVTPVAMKLKKLMPAIHLYHGDSQPTERGFTVNRVTLLRLLLSERHGTACCDLYLQLHCSDSVTAPARV
jgi:hypothetical protein